MKARTIPLAECGAWLSGGTPSKANESYWDGTLPWFSSKDIRKFYLEDSELHVSETGALAGSTIVPPGTILMVVRGMSLANEFRVGMTKVRAAFNQDLKALVPHEGFEPRYVAHALRALEPQILAMTGSSAHGTKRLATDVLLATAIPHLDLPEQRRIADVLDRADALRQRRAEAAELTDKALDAAFLKRFGDPVANPKGWETNPLGDSIEIQAGWSADGEPRPARPDELGVLKVSAVSTGRFLPRENKVVARESTKGRELVFPKRGDLLFSRANTRELVAAVCLVEEDCDNVFLPDKLWRITPRTERLTNEYLRFSLAHPSIRSRIAAMASGSSGSMLNVSQEKVRSIRIPFADPTLQRKFAHLVWKSLDARKKTEQVTVALGALFAALQYRAFHGEL